MPETIFIASLDTKAIRKVVNPPKGEWTNEKSGFADPLHTAFSACQKLVDGITASEDEITITNSEAQTILCLLERAGVSYVRK